MRKSLLLQFLFGFSTESVDVFSHCKMKSHGSRVIKSFDACSGQAIHIFHYRHCSDGDDGGGSRQLTLSYTLARERDRVSIFSEPIDSHVRCR